jgi:hypothetical protein
VAGGGTLVLQCQQKPGSFSKHSPPSPAVPAPAALRSERPCCVAVCDEAWNLGGATEI